MTDPAVQPWQIPILVTAAIVLVEMVLNLVLRRRGSLAVDKRVRTGALGLLLLLTVVVFVVALGPSLAESLSSVAAAVAAMVALWLTYRSYQAPQDAGRNGTGGPAQPPAEPSPSAAPPFEARQPVDSGGARTANGAVADTPSLGDRSAGVKAPVAAPGPRVGSVAPIWVPRLRWLRPRRRARRRS